MKKTRALWIALEREIRLGPAAPGRAFVKDCERFWARLTAEDRRDFVEAYSEYERCNTDFEERRAAADFRQTSANNIVIDAKTHCQSYIEDFETVAAEWEKLEEPRRLCEEAARRLAQVIVCFRADNETPPNPAHPEVEAWSLNKVNDLRSWRRIAANNKLAAQSNADSPPIEYQRPDGRVKLPADWVSKNVKMQQAVHRAHKFKVGKPGKGKKNWGHDQGWRGAWMFSEGALALAGLWVQVDGHDNVQDRVVRKDTYVDSFEWGHIGKWYGNIKDPANRLPYEIKCHQMLDGAESELQYRNLSFHQVNIPALRAYHVDDERRMYSMTMEYCSHRSLQYLIDYHIDNDMKRIPEVRGCVLAVTDFSCQSPLLTSVSHSSGEHSIPWLRSG